MAYYQTLEASADAGINAETGTYTDDKVIKHTTIIVTPIMTTKAPP
jgi:hypothetical protein